MNDDTFCDTSIIDMNDPSKEDEILNTIKMEPILEKTLIDEEPQLTKKKKRINAIDETSA